MKIANKSKRKRKRSPQQRPKKVNLTNPRIRKESIKNLTSKKVGRKYSLVSTNPLSNKVKNLTKTDKDKKKKKNKEN